MEVQLQEDTRIIYFILIAIGLFLLMAVAIVLFYYFSRRRIVKTELEKATLEIAYQKEIIQASLITQENERKRIAQDLHDAISSKLNIVSLHANLLTEAEIPSEETNKIGKNILDVTTNVLESSRQIAHDLLPATLDKFGLGSALEELCEEMDGTGRFRIEYHIAYSEGFLNPEDELQLFRIVQELMNNTIKHSGASVVRLTLKAVENALSLYYSDNGAGFNIVESTTVKGLGMSGIHNRARIINGDCEIVSSPGNGMEVILRILK